MNIPINCPFFSPQGSYDVEFLIPPLPLLHQQGRPCPPAFLCSLWSHQGGWCRAELPARRRWHRHHQDCLCHFQRCPVTYKIQESERLNIEEKIPLKPVNTFRKMLSHLSLYFIFWVLPPSRFPLPSPKTSHRDPEIPLLPSSPPRPRALPCCPPGGWRVSPVAAGPLMEQSWGYWSGCQSRCEGWGASCEGVLADHSCRNLCVLCFFYSKSCILISKVEDFAMQKKIKIINC